MTDKKMHPFQDFCRKEWKNLNGKWDFSFTEGKYDKKITVPFSWVCPLSGIEDKTQTNGFYRKKVKWNPSSSRIFLVFCAVDYFCSVKVNGVFLGSHTGGYSKFEFDVSDIWHREDCNIIEVAAEDKGKPSQTYGKQGYGDSKGIWQTVYLEGRPDSYIENFKIDTKTDGTVKFRITAKNCPDGAEASLFFGKNKASGKIYNGKATLSLCISSPVLWCPENPKLYSGNVVISYKNGETEISDTVHTYFGIREIGTALFDTCGGNKVRYVTLNGKPVFLSAFLDQSYNAMGHFTLPSDSECENEILRVKDAGLNSVRIHIKVEEPLKLYYADKHGVLVMTDMPCFWGEPTVKVRSQFEKEMKSQTERDYNHPSIIYRIIFNETWGLYSKDENGSPVYSDDTAKWVVKCYKSLKSADPSRIIEDMSPCHNDHTLTDINTWHFYSNGYSEVRNEIESFCKNSYEGSTSNYKEGFAMSDVPIMNSECGNYWGIKGNAGESDISFQYKYMINEFRRQSKMNGYVFTEFCDVINEFNGFYKLNRDKKIFGYESFGTNLKYLNGQIYIGADFPPVSSFKPNDKITVPIFVSSFTDTYFGKTMKVKWSLFAEDFTGGKRTFSLGEYSFILKYYGTTPVHFVSFKVPDYDGPATLLFELFDAASPLRIASNYVQFDFTGKDTTFLCISPTDLVSEGSLTVKSDMPEKISCIGKGGFSIDISPKDIPGITDSQDVKIYFEASTRFPMKHDYPDSSSEIFGNLMLGYAVDPGKNKNTFPQTDGKTHPGFVKILIDGTEYGTCRLPDCPADSRGFLSHFYQKCDNELNEAGSYGYICSCSVPSELFFESVAGKKTAKDSVKISFVSGDESGLSVFGRKSGRYGMGIKITGM